MAKRLDVSEPTVRKWLDERLLDRVKGSKPVEISQRSVIEVERILEAVRKGYPARRWSEALGAFLADRDLLGQEWVAEGLEAAAARRTGRALNGAGAGVTVPARTDGLGSRSRLVRAVCGAIPVGAALGAEAVAVGSGCPALRDEVLVFGDVLGVGEAGEHGGVHQLGHALGVGQGQDAVVGGHERPGGAVVVGEVAPRGRSDRRALALRVADAGRFDRWGLGLCGVDSRPGAGEELGALVGAGLRWPTQT